MITTYLHYFETKQETDFWAVDEVDTRVLRDPEKGWEITRTLVNRALTEEALAYIAAGPLEDLLNHHGAAVMVQIEQECLTNDNLFHTYRLLLVGFRFSVGEKSGAIPSHVENPLSLIFIKPVRDVDQELRAGISQLRSAIEECAGKLIWS